MDYSTAFVRDFRRRCAAARAAGLAAALACKSPHVAYMEAFRAALESDCGPPVEVVEEDLLPDDLLPEPLDVELDAIERELGPDVVVEAAPLDSIVLPGIGVCKLSIVVDGDGNRYLRSRVEPTGPE